MSLSKQPYKGARDFYPEQKRIQKFIFQKFREVVESYGYEEYDAPLLELEELYRAKSSDEIINDQTYAFKDRSDRAVVIRPEMTPSVSRMIAAKRFELNYPIRWYSIPNLWRYERPQNGRFREHWQLNVDIFGEQSNLAEVELMTLVRDIFKSFKAPDISYEIRINSRRLTNEFIELVLGLNPKTDSEAIKELYKLIDRIHKLEKSESEELLSKILNNKDKENKIDQFLNINDISKLKSTFPELQTTILVEEILSEAKLTNLIYDPTIVRGFNYYTDIVFEVTDTHPDNNRSIMGGGRYDNLVAKFDLETLPAVGFGLGDASFYNFLVAHDLLSELPNETTLAVLIIGDHYLKLQSFLDELRENNINISVNFSDKDITKKIKWAIKNNYSKVIIIGDNEIANQNCVLKDLETREEQTLSISKVIEQLR